MRLRQILHLLLLPAGILLITMSTGHAAKQEPLPENEPLPYDVEQALASTDSADKPAILYSLNPRIMPPKDWNKGKDLQGFAILGQTTLKPEQSAIAIQQVRTAMKSWDGMIAMCFSPRHGLTLTRKGVRYDFVICFECHRMSVFRNGKEIVSNGVTGSPDKLNAILKQAGAPLAPAPAPNDS
ncbi:MAG: hypothetical protein ACAI35_19425 [Candidatus Methylacidiphilales bacterium]